MSEWQGRWSTHTANRVTHARLPPRAGILVELTGLEICFYVIGALAGGLLAVIGFHAWRHDGFRTPGDS